MKRLVGQGKQWQYKQKPRGKIAWLLAWKIYSFCTYQSDKKGCRCLNFGGTMMIFLDTFLRTNYLDSDGNPHKHGWAQIEIRNTKATAVVINIWHFLYFAKKNLWIAYRTLVNLCLVFQIKLFFASSLVVNSLSMTSFHFFFCGAKYQPLRFWNEVASLLTWK